jgi:uncharacterized Zn-finger protein
MPDRSPRLEETPLFFNELGVRSIDVGAAASDCMGAMPPDDHPHVYLNMAISCASRISDPVAAAARSVKILIRQSCKEHVDCNERSDAEPAADIEKRHGSECEQQESEIVSIHDGIRERNAA